MRSGQRTAETICRSFAARAAGALAAAALACALGLLASAAWAADAQSVYEDIFGKEAKQVAASPDKSDDAEFAARLLKAADELQDQPELKVLLYEKACEFGLHGPAGYATADKALTALDKIAPDRKADTEDKRVDLLQALYHDAKTADEKAKVGRLLVDQLIEAGDARAQAEQFSAALQLYRRAQGVADAIRSDRKDDIAARLKLNTPRVAVEQQIEPLKTRLKAKPDDTAAAESLVRLYLVDLDNPVAAAAYADQVSDETMKKYLLVAAMHLENLPEKACLALGDWYVDLAASAGPAAKPSMLRRAKAYYEQFVALHADEDADRTRAAAAIQKLTRDLEGPAGTNWIDLLKLVDPAKDAAAGKWQAAAGLLASDESGPALLRLPYQPAEEYDVQVVFTRQAGAGDVGILLSKAGAQFEWIMDVGGSRCGFETIAGQRVVSPKNPTGFTGILKNAQRYTLLIQVRNGDVKALVDGRLAADLKTDYKNLSTYSDFAIPNTKCLGLVTYRSVVIFQSIRVLDVTGKGKVGRDPPVKTGG